MRPVNPSLGCSSDEEHQQSWLPWLHPRNLLRDRIRGRISWGPATDPYRMATVSLTVKPITVPLGSLTW